MHWYTILFLSWVLCPSFIHLFLSLCLSIFLPLHLSIFLPLKLSIYIFIFLALHLSIYLSICFNILIRTRICIVLTEVNAVPSAISPICIFFNVNFMELKCSRTFDANILLLAEHPTVFRSLQKYIYDLPSVGFIISAQWSVVFLMCKSVGS